MNDPDRGEQRPAPRRKAASTGELPALAQRLDQLERELAEARGIFENAAVGMAVSQPDEHCLTVRCNAAMTAMMAWRSETVPPPRLYDHIHPDDRSLFKECLARMLSGARQSVRRELRFVSEDGRHVWGRWTGSLVRDGAGNAAYMIHVVEDISDRKRTEQRLASDEDLLRRLIDLQDRERKMLAFDLHDGLIQYIAGAQLAIQSLEATAKLDDQQRTALTQAARSLARALNAGRRVIGELRPMCLEELNIVEAISYLIHEEEAQGDLQINFLHRVESDRFDPLLENTLFRAVQELLTNVRRHSQATRAEVRFTEIGSRQLVLEVQDWGIGFDAADRPLDRFGLESVCERARLLGGGASIESTIGKGTRVTVRLPSFKKFAPTPDGARWTWTV